MLPHTAILYEDVADILRGCPADTKLVILDCCHAELGNKANYVFQSADLAEAYPVDGLYFIGASKTREKAKAPKDGLLTYFTQNLIDTIEQGIPNKPEFLGLDQIFVALRGRMVRQGLPEPVESGTRGARRFPFARNTAPIEAPIDQLAAAEERANEAQAQAGPLTASAVTRTDDHGNSAGETLQPFQSSVPSDHPRVAQSHPHGGDEATRRYPGGAADVATGLVASEEPVFSSSVEEPIFSPPPLRLVTNGSATETRVSGARAGRGWDAEPRLPEDLTVSRAHARFTFARGQWWVTNLGRNGLLLNGIPLSGERMVRPGDTIRWGCQDGALASRVEIAAEDLLRADEDVLDEQPQEPVAEVATGERDP